MIVPSVTPEFIRSLRGVAEPFPLEVVLEERKETGRCDFSTLPSRRTPFPQTPTAAVDVPAVRIPRVAVRDADVPRHTVP